MGTSNEDQAQQIIQAKNQSLRQWVLNGHIAKAYLAGSDNGINTRTWQQAIEALINTKQDANKEHWMRVAKDAALTPLLPKVIIETQAELLLRVLNSDTVSTNVHLRRLHNFCVDRDWLTRPLVPRTREIPDARHREGLRYSI